MSPKLITAAHAAELLGITKPTFYRLSEEDTTGLLTPLQSTGAQMWVLDKVLKYLTKRDVAEAKRRQTLLTSWGMESEQTGS